MNVVLLVFLKRLLGRLRCGMRTCATVAVAGRGRGAGASHLRHEATVRRKWTRKAPKSVSQLQRVHQPATEMKHIHQL